MAFCKKCGAQLRDEAKFCPECGASRSDQGVPEQTFAPTSGASDMYGMPIGYGKELFKRLFMILFVTFGLLGLVCSALSATYIAISFAFGITLAVFAILFTVAFCVFGIVRFVFSRAENADARRKYAICFAVALIVSLYIVLSCVAVFVIGDALNAIL